MEGLMVACLSCLAILLQIYGVFCNEHMADHQRDNEERSRRYHESDCLKERLKNEHNKTIKNLRNVGKKSKCPQKQAHNEKSPINERNEPKNVRNINHILEEIANVAHKHSETKGIEKIRHLVDEIAKQEEQKSKLSKPLNINNEKIENNIIVMKSRNHTKPKEETNKLPQESCSDLKKVTDKNIVNPIKTKDTTKITIPLLTSERRFNNQVSDRNEATGINYDYDKMDMENGNFIEINEHKYEEEMLRFSCYKNNEASTYTDWCIGQNYNPGYFNRPYYYNGKDNDMAMYEANYSNYPKYAYSVNDNGNVEYYIGNCNDNTVQSFKEKEYYMTHRKTWLDRETRVATRDPGGYMKTINEDRKEINNIVNEHSPNFYKKYKCIRTNQFSSSNLPLNNQYTYCTDPYHCS